MPTNTTGNEDAEIEAATSDGHIKNLVIIINRLDEELSSLIEAAGGGDVASAISAITEMRSSLEATNMELNELKQQSQDGAQ